MFLIINTESNTFHVSELDVTGQNEIAIEDFVMPADSSLEYYIVNEDKNGIVFDEFMFLETLKKDKYLEIENAKSAAQLEPVEVRGLLFNGGRIAGQKYDESLRLALKLNDHKLKLGFSEEELVVEGSFGLANGETVKVDEDYANEVILAVAGKTYVEWEKAQGLLKMVRDATSKEQVESISWDMESSNE